MLNQISWATYFQTIAILLIIYYVIILFLFYKKEMSQLVVQNTQPGFAIEQPGQDIFPEVNRETFIQSEAIEYILDEVRALIRQAGYSRSPKEEILFALQKLISSDRFQTIRESPFPDAINNLIAEECQTNCSMHLSEEDLKRLWVSK